MKPLIVRITDTLKVTNRTTNQLKAALYANRGEFIGTAQELLLYVSVLVKKKMQQCDVFVAHLNDGQRIVFMNDDVPNMGLVVMEHEHLTFKD